MGNSECLKNWKERSGLIVKCKRKNCPFYNEDCKYSPEENCIMEALYSFDKEVKQIGFV